MPDYGHALAFGYFLQPESAKTDFPAASPGDFKIDQAGMFYLALVEQLLSIVKQICAGYLGYPFQNKQVKSFVENLARDVDK